MVNFDNDEEEDLTVHLNLQIFREHHDLFSHRSCNIEEIQQLDFFFSGVKIISMRRGCVFFSDHFEMQERDKKIQIWGGINHKIFQSCCIEVYLSSEIRDTFFLAVSFLLALFDQLLAGLDSICGYH